MAAVGVAAGCKLLEKSNIKRLLDSVDTILCDCDGVLYNGNTALPGAANAVHNLKKLVVGVWSLCMSTTRGFLRLVYNGKRFFYVTNNSAKTRKEFMVKCDNLGFPAVEDDVIGSGYVTAQTIKKLFNYTGKAYVLGSSSLAWELSQVGITAVGIGPDGSKLSDLQSFVLDDEVKCVVVGFDEHFSYVKAGKAVSYLQNKNCLFISTNTDSGLPVGNGRIFPGTGSILAMIQTASQRMPDVICGKPHQPMFDVLMNRYKLDPKRTLMIGDRLDTDILFAGNCGLQSLLVLSGFSTLDEVHRKQTSGAVEDQKQIPMYYLPSLGDLVPMLGV